MVLAARSRQRKFMTLSRFEDEPVVIAAFQVGEDARLAVALLTQAEVDVVVQRYDPAIERRCDGAFERGFDLIVPAAEAELAIALLQRLWREKDDAGPQAFARCPACGSLEVSRLRRALIFALTVPVLLFGAALTGERELFLLMIAIVGGVLLLARPNRCRVCDERWRGGDAPVAGESGVESPEIPCPRCGAKDSERIERRREKATTLLVNFLMPPLLFVWPFLPRRRCSACGHQWR